MSHKLPTVEILFIMSLIDFTSTIIEKRAEQARKIKINELKKSRGKLSVDSFYFQFARDKGNI